MAQKCRSCNNQTNNPSGACYLHESGGPAALRVGSVGAPKLGSLKSSSGTSGSTNGEQIAALIDEYEALQREHGAEEESLRTAANKARSVSGARKTSKAYSQFLDRSGWKVKKAALQDRAEALGASSLGELHASRSFAQRTHGNGNLPLPPRVPSDALTPYSFGTTRGWLTAQVNSNTGNETQFFLHTTKDGKWVSKQLNKAQDPLGDASRMEIRPDNLDTFSSEVHVPSLQKPVGPIDGKYPLDSEV